MRLPRFKRRPKPKGILLNETSSLTKQVLWGALILFFVIGFSFLAYRVNSRLRPPEYEGKIIDKWAGYRHSDEGSFPYFRILLETDEGGRLTVAVDAKTYDRAKIGMRIKKSSKGIELSLLKVASPARPGLIRVDYYGSKEVPTGTCHAILKAAGIRQT